MSKATSKREDPLLDKYQYTGKIYRLAGADDQFSYEDLASELEEKEIHENLSYDEGEDIEVPDVFQADGDGITMMTNFNSIKITRKNNCRVLSGFILTDDPREVTFRDQRILVMDTSEVRFSIFQNNEKQYLVMMGSQDLVDSVIEMIRGDLEDIGIAAKQIEFQPRDITNIKDKLADELLNTIFKNYSRSSMDKKKFWGRDYENDPDYQQEKDRAEVRGHMIATTKLVDKSEKVISIFDDGLVQSCSNMKLITYIEMIQDYILPNSIEQRTLNDFE